MNLKRRPTLDVSVGCRLHDDSSWQIGPWVLPCLARRSHLRSCNQVQWGLAVHLAANARLHALCRMWKKSYVSDQESKEVAEAEAKTWAERVETNPYIQRFETYSMLQTWEQITCSAASDRTEKRVQSSPWAWEESSGEAQCPKRNAEVDSSGVAGCTVPLGCKVVAYDWKQGAAEWVE